MEIRYAATALHKKSCVPEPFPGAGEGIRTPDPLITNQMLYRLSYASNFGQRPFSEQH
jgi:hypothetical protein